MVAGLRSPTTARQHHLKRRFRSQPCRLSRDVGMGSRTTRCYDMDGPAHVAFLLRCSGRHTAETPRLVDEALACSSCPTWRAQCRKTALRRPVAARGAPAPWSTGRRCCDGRTDGRDRQQAARDAPARDQARAPRASISVLLRDARPGRGATMSDRNPVLTRAASSRSARRGVYDRPATRSSRAYR